MQSRLEDDNQNDNSGDLIPIRLLGGAEHFEDVAGGMSGNNKNCTMTP